jgi:hypothetical protein
MSQQNLLKDSEYRTALFARLRMAIPGDYPGLAEDLGLTAEQADKLFDRLVETQVEKRGADVPIILGQQPDPAAIQAMIRARQQIQLRQDEALRAMLGGDRYERFTEYVEGRPGRTRATEIGRILASAGQPLSDVQAKPLTAAFVAEARRRLEFSRRRVSELRPYENPVDQMAVDAAYLEFQTDSNRRMVEAAQPHLSVQQLEILKAALDQPLAESRAAARVQREQSETGR